MNTKTFFVATLAVVNLATTSVSANTGDRIADEYAVSPDHLAVDPH